VDPRVRQALRTETFSELWIVIQDAASRQGADRLDLPPATLRPVCGCASCATKSEEGRNVSHTTVPVTTTADPTTTVKAACPSFPIGNLQPISGGVKLEVKNPALTVLDSHAIANGWTATVYNNTMAPPKADMILSCARSIAVSGSTLPSS